MLTRGFDSGALLLRARGLVGMVKHSGGAGCPLVPGQGGGGAARGARGAGGLTATHAGAGGLDSLWGGGP